MTSDEEVFDQIARQGPEFSRPHPEMEAIFEKHGRPRPFLPKREAMPRIRQAVAITTARFMKSPFVRETLGSLPQPDCRTEDRSVPGSSGQMIPIRIYTPAGSPSTGKPVCILAHNGGFCTGGLDTEEFIARMLSRSHGLIIVDVDYRLAPEAKFPAGVFDVYDVVKWVAKNAASIGGNLSKGFILGGVSCGGNYTVASAYMARDEGLQPPITGTFFVCTGMPHAMADIAGNHKELYPGKLVSWEENKDNPIGGRQSNQYYGDLAECRADDPYLTPFTQRDHSNLPPVFYQTNGMDIWRDSAIYYSHLRREAGSPTKLVVYPGLPHTWWYFYPEISVTKQWARDLVDGVAWLLQLSNSGRTSARL